MCENKSFNTPIAHDEDLDSIMEEIYRINNTSFDTWYQRIARFIGKLLPTIKFDKNIVYEVNEETGEVYIGINRRKTIRRHKILAKRFVLAIRVGMMPKTILIKEIKEAA